MKSSTKMLVALVCVAAAAALAYKHHEASRALIDKAYASVSHLLGQQK